MNQQSNGQDRLASELLLLKQKNRKSSHRNVSYQKRHVVGRVDKKELKV